MVHRLAEEGQFITCTSQINNNSLVYSLPWLHWARLKDSSTWRLLANCPFEELVFHNLPELTSRVFSLPFSSCVAFTHSHFHQMTDVHLFLIFGCLFFQLLAISEGTDLVAPAIHLQLEDVTCLTQLTGKHCSPRRRKKRFIQHWPPFRLQVWTHISLPWVQQLAWPLCAELHISDFPWPIAVELVTICLHWSSASAVISKLINS